MSFVVEFGTVKEERNKLWKNFTAKAVLTGSLREETSIIRPVIQVKKAADKCINYNYCKIEEFGRYYFVNEIRSITTDITELSLEVDVLMTYYSQIRQIQGIVDRTSTDDYIDRYMDDGLMPNRINPWIDIYNFPKSFSSDQSMVLIVSSANNNP